MQGSLFRSQAIEQQKDRLHGDVLVLPSIPQSCISIFILLWVVACLFWASTSNYARKESVNGWLEPPSGVVRIYAENSSGEIKQLLVKEGQRVVKDQPLAIINGDRILDSGEHLETMLLDEYKDQQAMLNNQLERTGSIYRVRLEDIRQQISASEKDLERLNAQIVTVEKRQQLLKKRVSNYLKMKNEGNISGAELDSSLEQELALSSEYQALLRNKVNQGNRIQQLQTQLKLLPQEHQNSLEQIKSNLSSIAQKMAQLHGQRAHIIKATRAGIVTNLQAKEGQQTNTNTPLLTLLPDDAKIEAHLLIPVRSAGFVIAGQKLDIRYDAFPYQKFGIYAGEVLSISESILLPNEVHSAPLSINEPVYLVRASLAVQTVNAYGKEMLLKSGMTLSADVQLSNRSLLEWMLEPIFSLRGRI